VRAHLLARPLTREPGEWTGRAVRPIHQTISVGATNSPVLGPPPRSRFAQYPARPIEVRVLEPTPAAPGATVLELR
jgi:hypothetical protein